MLRAIEHLHRIVNRAASSEALPESEIKRARACLGLIHAEHHAELSRLLLARAEESQARLAAERECGRLRQQVASWRSAAEAAWETLETSLAQITARRPSLRLIERPPLLRHRPGQGRARSEAGAGEDDPSPFFWPKFRRYGSALKTLLTQSLFNPEERSTFDDQSRDDRDPGAFHREDQCRHGIGCAL